MSEAIGIGPAGLIRQLRRYPSFDPARYRRFIVVGRHVGWIGSNLARRLGDFPKVFDCTGTDIHLRSELSNVEARSKAMAEVLAELRAEGRIPGWRDELYPVNRRFDEPPLLLMERGAAPIFGTITYGINVNGLVDGGSRVWVARRSTTKQVDPGKLDVIVGGGQPYGFSPFENLLKECAEEASIPISLAMKANPVSVITLMIEAEEGLRVGFQFNYDLELPARFKPVNKDGEVAEFQLWPVAKLLESLRSADDFMYDVALAKIDLLIRHGFIGPEEPDYLHLVAGLRRPVPFEEFA